MRSGARPSLQVHGEPTMFDIAFLLLGAAAFGLFGAFAAFLRRV